MNENTIRRIFIGFKLDVIEQLIYMKEMLPIDLRNQIKWVSENNLHLTFLFIGQVNNSDIARISEALKNIATKHIPFNLETGGIGIFKKKRKNNILWLKVKHCESLNNLQSSINTTICELLDKPELFNSNYTPHITLARYRHNIILPEYIFNHKFENRVSEVNEIQIIESISGINGLEYPVLKHITL